MFRPVDRDVFVHDLNRQLGSPSRWLSANSCKKGTKRRPSGRVHSDAQVSQQETPKNCPPTYLSTACGTLKMVKNCVYVCVLSPSGKNILQSLVRNLKARASNQRVSRKFAKGSNPFSDILSAI